MNTLVQNIGIMCPEFTLALGGMALLMLGVFAGDRSEKLLSQLTVALLVVTGAAVVLSSHGKLTAFNGSLAVDDFARMMKLLVLAGAALVLLMSQGYLQRQKMGRFEFPVLVVFSTLGMMLMVSAGDFITLYMGMELQSLALYVLAAFEIGRAHV